jgi:phosphate butyryltransferase
MEEIVLQGKRQKLVLAAAQSEEALCAVDEAARAGIVDVVLVGSLSLIKEKASQGGIDVSKYEIIEAATEDEAARKSVALIREGKAQLLMKGFLETSDFLRAVLSSESGIKTNRRLCSVVAMECASLDRIIVLADVGTNISPNVKEKADIIESCVLVAKALGAETPKAAVLCAHEKVQCEAMPITAEAALLSVMAERGQVAGNPIVDGPISMDLAVNFHAVSVKKYKGKIQGDADILIAPNLEAGNILIKGLMYLSKDIRVAGVGMGAKVPLVLSSRGDDRDTKYYSIVLASLISQRAV